MRIKSDDEAHEIDLEVISVRAQTAADNFYIIVFGESLNDGRPTSSAGARCLPKKRNSTTSEREQAAREIKNSGTNCRRSWKIMDHSGRIAEPQCGIGRKQPSIPVAMVGDEGAIVTFMNVDAIRLTMEETPEK